MTDNDDRTPDDEAQRDRASRLSAAILRITASLDVDTVLREAVDSARALTGARYGLIATRDLADRPLYFVGSGLTPDETRMLQDWPHAPQVYEHLRNLDAPLRVADLPGYLRALGFDPVGTLSNSLQATPLRQRGVYVGGFFLGEKHGGRDFTKEDEEVLVLFASQAMAAIDNARAHLAEQRARADLEALIETTPVGVVVFDAATGRPRSLNREAKRIVGALHMPGLSHEQLLDVMTYRRADGREFPLARQLSDAMTVRAEEIVLSVPDGRSVTALVNATPIRSADGAVESVVVTLQDLAPLNDLERLRAEFLGLVSHELRAPLTSIKGAAATVLGAAPPLHPAETVQFFRIIDEQADHMSGLIGDLLDAGRIETGTLSVAPEPTEVAALVDQARTTFLSAGARHAVQIDLPPDLPPVLADRQRIVQVLNNLLSNAARHAPESTPIRIAAARHGAHAEISVSDEGKGVPAERLPHLFRKYAGVGDREPGSAGAGLGLAICRGLVEAHGGRIRAESAGTGQGTRFTFTIPVVQAAGDARGAAGATRNGPGGEPILVVDDDPQTLRYVRDTLATAGYAPLVTGDPGEVSRLLRTEKPHLVLLDLMLPGTDGIELMGDVPELADVPVIFISGYGRDETIARALESGASDYIVKPFSPTELTARIRAALRKRADPEPFVLGDLEIDYDRRRLRVAGRPVPLTATEYELLRVLSVNAGRVVTLDALLRQVWGGRDNGPGPVRAYVKRLRKKLGDDAARPAYILTERGVGYRMAAPDDT